jgi:hypothetical protein
MRTLVALSLDANRYLSPVNDKTFPAAVNKLRQSRFPEALRVGA